MKAEDANGNCPHTFIYTLSIQGSYLSNQYTVFVGTDIDYTNKF